MAARPDLLATCWTSAGDAAPGRRFKDLGRRRHWGVEMISAEHRRRGCVEGLEAAYRAPQGVFNHAVATRSTR
jgi:hypothetical protein